jgi:hypothetical protein
MIKSDDDIEDVKIYSLVSFLRGCRALDKVLRSCLETHEAWLGNAWSADGNFDWEHHCACSACTACLSRPRHQPVGR